MGTASEGSRRTPVGTVLVRAGYALAGALVAVLVAWVLTLAPWPPDAALASSVTTAVAMAATLMLWASFKPSHGSSVSTVLEALLVGAAPAIVLMAGDMVRAGSQLGLIEQFFGYALSLLITGFGVVLPVSWMLGSSMRWARRSLRWCAGELTFAALMAVLSAAGAFSSRSSGLPLGALVFSGALGVLTIAAVLAAAASIQWMLCEAIRRARGLEEAEPDLLRPGGIERVSPPRPAPRHAAAPDGSPMTKARKRLRTVCIVVLVASVALSALSLVFFFGCRHYAIAQGLNLRNVVYSVPSICVLLTCFVVVPFVGVEAASGSGKDYRVTGYAVLSALVLFAVMFSATFRLEPPEEVVLGDGSIKVTTPVWLDKPRVAYAHPEGPLFMRMLPDPIKDTTTQKPLSPSDSAQDGAVENASSPNAPADSGSRSGYSYHNTGSIMSIDLDARTLVMAVSDSTENIAIGTQVSVECASAEHLDVPLEALAVGDSVQIRSTQAQSDGVIVAQKVFGMKALGPEREPTGEEALDEALQASGCTYTVSGTVTSAIGENGFSFRIDDGGGTIENGTELRVSTVFVESRLYGMKGLQWGMDGVIVGFSDLPVEGVLRAKVIVGNDDTSSDYWENMPPA